MERIVAAAVEAILLVSLVAILLGSAIGVLLGTTLGRTKQIPKYLLGIAGAIGCLSGAWLGQYLWWTYYAAPIVHDIGIKQHRAPEPGEPPGMLLALLLGGLSGACLASCSIIVWTSSKER
jgi:hypothetical protein